MSSVPGLAVQSKDKGGKSKFQSLDINSLYRVSLGESLEPQQKALPRKHGMQSLGKVPSARRPPANLPSLKSEHSGQDPAISLVPSGGAGWGAKEGGGPTPPPQAQAPPQQQQQVAAQAPTVAQQQQQQQQQSAASAPVPMPPVQREAQPVAPVQQPPQQPQVQQQAPRGGGGGPQEKLWSSLMCTGASGGPGGQEGPSFLAHQSPMFQHEFPSLSADKAAAAAAQQQHATSQDSQYGPGPSLRPQTEGSWMQGGMARAGVDAGRPMDPAAVAAAAAAGGRANSAMQAASQQASGPGGQPAPPLPPQLRGLIPPFMFRGSNFGPGGPPFPPNYQITAQQQQQQQQAQQGQPGARQGRYPENRQGPPRYGAGGRPMEDDGMFTRPIIKEEDLKQLDEIVRDNGWATSDDIDYNQKLAFSDDEGQEEVEGRPRVRQQQQQMQQQQQGDRQSNTDQNKDMRDDRRPGSRGEVPRPWQQQQQQQQQQNQQQQQAQQQGRVHPADFHRQFPVKLPVFGPGQQQPPQVPPPQQSGPALPPPANQARLLEDEEVWRERRRQQSEEVALAVERAKQRKEEEEKRYRETREAAAKKLQMLEEKMGVAPSSQHSAQPSSPQPQEELTVSPVPESCKSPQPPQSECWASQVEAAEKLAQQQQAQSPQQQQSQPDFRPPQQPQQAQQQQQQQQPQQQQQQQQQQELNMPVQSYTAERERERELRKERGPMVQPGTGGDRHEAMPFSPKFSEDLPPRFAKQKQMMLRTGPQATQQQQQQQTQSTTPPPLLATPIPPPPNFEQRWGNQHFGKGQRGNRRGAPDLEDDRPPSRDREALRGDKSERFRGRGGGRYYETRENDNWHRDEHQWSSQEHKDQNKSADTRHLQNTAEWFDEKENSVQPQETPPAVPPPLMGDWRAPEPLKDWADARPQRPDSRDSKASSRDSRHSAEKQAPSGPSTQPVPQESNTGAWSNPTEQFYDKDSEKQASRKGWKRDKDSKDSWHDQPARSLVKNWGEDSTPPSSSSPGLELPSGTTKLSTLLADSLQPGKKQDEALLDSKPAEEQRGRDGKNSRSRGRRDARSPRGGSSSSCNTAGAWPTYPVYQKTWGRSGSTASTESGRGGRGRGSRLHPAPGAGRPSNAWEQESDQSGEEMDPASSQGNRRSRKTPRSPKRGSSASGKPRDDKGNVSAIGEQRSSKPAQGDKPSAKPVGTKEGFAPRGEPSRRGRGGGGSRPRGGMGRGIDGYGPPAKSPFGPPREDKKSDSKHEEEEARTKLGGMVPLSSAINARGKPSAVPPRMQRSKEAGEGGRGSSKRRGNGRGKSPSRTMVKQGSSDGAEENWETTSENSDEDSRGKGRRGGAPQPRGGKSAGPVSRPVQFPTASKAPGAEKKTGLGNTVRQTPSPLSGRKESSPGLDLSEADKKQRLEKEMDALDISTYSAVTSMVEEQQLSGNDDSHYFSNFEASNGFPSRGGKKPPTPPITPPVGGGRGSSAPGGRGGKPVGPAGPQRDKMRDNKPGYDRSRVSKLPPRLAKQKENNRLQKAAAANAMQQQQQQHHMGPAPSDMLDMGLYHVKDSVSLNAWEKPLGSATSLGGLSEPGVLEDGSVDITVNKLAREGEDSADMKLDFAFDTELLSEDKGKPRGPHPSSPSSGSSATGSTAELNLKIASVKKVWESVPAMPTVLEHTSEDSSVPTQTFTGFEQTLDATGYKEPTTTEEIVPDVAYSGGEVMVSGSYTVAPGTTSSNLGKDAAQVAATSSNVCKVKPQQQAVMSSTGPSPIGHPSPLSPPPFSSTTAQQQQQGHMGYPVGRSTGVEGVSCWQPATAAALGGGGTQYSGISAIPSPPTVLFNTNQQMQAQSGLYGAFQLDNQRSQFSQFPPYGLNTSNPAAGFNQNLYLQSAPPPPPPTAPQPNDMYPAPPPSLSQYRLQAAAAPFGQTPQHVTSNPSTVLISSSSNSLMSASVKPSSQQHVGAIGSKTATYQTSAPPPPQPSPLYISYEHPSLLSMGGQSFTVGGSQLVQRQGPVQSNVVPASAIQPPTSFFSNNANQAGYYQGNSALQPPPHAAGPPSLHNTGNPYASAAAAMSGYSTQGAGNAAAVGLPSFSSQVIMAAAAAAAAQQQFRSSAAYLKSTGQPPPPNDLGRQLKSPSSAELGVFPPGQQASSPKARTKQPPSLPSPTLQQQQPQHPKFGTYPSAAVLQHQLPPSLTDARWCVQPQQPPPPTQQQQQRGGGSGTTTQRGMSQGAQRYPNPIQRPAVPFQGGMPPQNMSVRPPRLPATQQQQQQQRGGANKLYNAQGGSTPAVEKPTEETNGVTSSSSVNATPVTDEVVAAVKTSTETKETVEEKAQ